MPKNNALKELSSLKSTLFALSQVFGYQGFQEILIEDPLEIDRMISLKSPSNLYSNNEIQKSSIRDLSLRIENFLEDEIQKNFSGKK